MQLKVKKLNKNAIIPTQGSAAAAGYDLYAAIDESVSIAPGECKKIGTGLAFELPEGYYMGIYARSGLSTKQGLRLANTTGICDEDYRGEYIVPLYNDSNTTRVINPGDRIAQMILHKYYKMTFIEDELNTTERGSGGFGSTDI